MNPSICNNCGANYEYHNGRWKCPACGAYKAEELSNEEVTLLYNAAQKLRFCDFDEAEKAYSDIIEKFPKNPNGYWGRLLSRYGIKYEEDFDGRKIPTCYATSIESVITDKDYLKAMELADQETRAYYTLQAQYIERVRKEWVEKAKKEKPYDIFICYKDSDLANGIDRTQDSIAAQELYIHLTEQGYRVFFSRESLRGKVGEKYEPYIFNALSTAKVMLVYGSKSEYITSTWLKNEWTRYEQRLQVGEKKPNSLIVACDGFSPSELPKVLSSMQCFDATSRSFYTDLDAFLKKMIKGEEKPKPVVEPKPEKKKSKALPITIAAVLVAIAIMLCILLPNLLGNKSSASITNSKYGVVISADSDIFDENTSLIVDKLTTGAQFTALVSTVNNSQSVEIKNAIVYDIECDAAITKNVTIKVAYSKSFTDSTIKVYYVSDDKSVIEEHSCIYDDGFVEFKTSHLSYYVIGEIKKDSSDTSTTIERVGIRIITFSDKFTTEYVLARWEGGSKSDASMIEIMDQYGAQQGGGKLHIANPGDFVEEIDEWLFSPERKAGDYAIIENAYGYSLCYISSINPSDNGNGDLEPEKYLTYENGVLQVGVCADYEPYEYIDNGQLKGIEIDILKAIANELGLEICFENDEFEDLLYNLNAKEVDCIIGVSETVERNQTATASKIMFSDADTGMDSIIYVNKDCNDLLQAINNAIFQLQRNGVISEIITLYAIGKEVPKDKVVVYFHTNGGTGVDVEMEIDCNTTFDFPECEFTCEGYSFDGWSTNVEGTSHLYSPGHTYQVDDQKGELHFYATWLPNENTLVLDSNGGYFSGEGGLDAIVKPTGSTVKLPAAPFSRDGYTFIGWSTTAHGSVEYADQAEYIMGTQPSYTLYAVWEIISYTITYDTDGGTISDELISTYTVNTESFMLPRPSSYPDKKGYVFAGWSGTGITGIQEFVTVPQGSIGNRSYTAHWTPATYTITLDANCGILQCDEYYSVTYNSNYHITPPTRAGFDFLGWGAIPDGPDLQYTDSNGDSLNVYSNTGDITLYAIWEVVDYSITYETDGGTLSGHKASYNVTTSTFTLPTPEKEDYIFLGWSGTGISGIQTTVTVSKGSTGNRTYTAHWELNPYTITLDANGGTVESATATVKYGSNYTIAPAKRPGYIFLGWFGGTESNANIYTDGYGDSLSAWNKAEGATFYAQWKADFSEGLTYTTLEGSINGVKVYAYEVSGIGTCTDKIIRLPIEIDGVPVISIAKNAFANNTAIESVVFPETLHKNKYDLYAHFNHYIGGGTSVTSQGFLIKDEAFRGCSNLKTVTLNCVSTIGQRAFSECTNLNEVLINEDSILQYIGRYSFENCLMLEGLVIPNSCTIVDAYAFSGSTQLSLWCEASSQPEHWHNDWNNSNCKVYWGYLRNGHRVEFDYNGATENTSVTYRFVEEWNTYIFPIPTKTGYTFGGWYEGTTRITDANGLTLSAWTIARTCTLKAKWNPNTNTVYTVKHYQQNADDDQYTLTNTQTFYGTTDSSVTPSVNTYAHFNSPSTKTETIKADGSLVIEYYYTRETITVSFITNGGNSIAAAEYRYGQSSSALPTPVRTGFTFGGWYQDEGFYNSAFQEGTITWEDTIYSYWTEENKPSDFQYEGDSEITITWSQWSDETVVIPAYIGGKPVTTIASRAFVQKTDLISVTIPANTKIIGEEAFLGCTKLKNVILPDGLETIEANAFNNCSSLAEISIPNTVTSIGEFTFSGCYALKSVSLPNNISSIKNVFSYCIGLESINLPNSITNMEGAFANCTALKTVNIPTSVTTFDSAFYYCGNLKSIEIPSTVTAIGGYVFFGSGLTSISIPNSVTSIGDSAFYQCYNLVDVSIPKTVTTIGSGAFSHCSNLTNVYITDINAWCAIDFQGMFANPLYYADNLYLNGSLVTSLNSCTTTTKISPYAFWGYSSITNITIPDNITEIGANAFECCSNLESVTINKGVSTIGDYAFGSCDKLTIYCEVSSKPDGWSEYWNTDVNLTACEVVWFYIGDIWDGTTATSFAGGSGTADDPYLIATAEQLAYLMQSSQNAYGGEYFKLTTNIHLMDIVWTPIGRAGYFYGHFDGSGYTIYNLNVQPTNNFGAGLFGSISRGSIKNLNVVNANIATDNIYSGIICGSTGSASVLENCYAQGTITITCRSTDSAKYVGGIAGDWTGSIERCRSNAIIDVNVNECTTSRCSLIVGGIAGMCRLGSIKNCYAEGDVSTIGDNATYHYSKIGGIVGSFGWPTCEETIENCYSNVDITSSTMASGYVGGIVGGLSTATVISNCFSVGDILIEVSDVRKASFGRIISNNSEATIQNCYADDSQVAKRYDANSTINEPSDTLESPLGTHTLQSSTFIFDTLGWSSDIWQINESSFPTLK